MAKPPTEVLFSPSSPGVSWTCVQKAGSQRVALEVRRLDDATFALRQSTRLTWEAPIMYLLWGERRALLLDTGAVDDARVCPVQPTIHRMLATWAAELGIDVPELVVAHTHGHQDHTAGDPQFAFEDGTTVVPKDRASVHRFFGIGGEAVTPFELGDRTVLVTAAPGHDDRSIAVLDPERGYLFTGDLAYRGRLTLTDLNAARASLHRLVALAEEHGVRQVFGGHVERNAYGVGYPTLLRWHADEAPWILTLDDLRAVRDTVIAAPGPGAHPGAPMDVLVGTCAGPLAKLAARGMMLRMTGRG